MAKRKAAVTNEQKTLVDSITTGSAERVDKVIRFSNEDVPNYLKRLRKLENRASRIRVTTG